VSIPQVMAKLTECRECYWHNF